jgi:hypothetical protein
MRDLRPLHLLIDLSHFIFEWGAPMQASLRSNVMDLAIDAQTAREGFSPTPEFPQIAEAIEFVAAINAPGAHNCDARQPLRVRPSALPPDETLGAIDDRRSPTDAYRPVAVVRCYTAFDALKERSMISATTGSDDEFYTEPLVADSSHN